MVPVIDIEPFLAGGPRRRAEVAGAVDAACSEVGFLVITGHGVPHDAIDDVYEASAAFFALPLEEKMAVASPHVAGRGFTVTVAPRSVSVPFIAATMRFAIAVTSMTSGEYSTRPARESRRSASMIAESRVTAVWM